MSILQDKSTRQVALVGGVLAVFGIAALAFRRSSRAAAPATGAPGTLGSVAATPGCQDLVLEAGWLQEINDQIFSLTEMEVERAKSEEDIANPAKVSQKLLRMISPDCPTPPPPEHPMYPYYEEWTRQSYQTMQAAGLQPGQGLLPNYESYLAFVEE